MPNKITSFLQKLVGTKKIPAEKPSGYIGFGDQYRFLYDSGMETMLKSYQSWVYAAVSKRADEFAGLKLTLNKIVKKGKETEIEPVKNHPVLELLDKVNPFITFSDLLKITQTYKDLAGNAYWWLIKSGNTITEIWPYLRPDRMTVVPSAQTFIAGYKYITPGRGEFVDFTPEEIIHFKYPNPLDPYSGVSPMQACYLAYNTYLKSSEYNNRFFTNNARADFLLTFPNGLTDAEAKAIRAQWEVRHRGEGHEHRVGILSGDAKLLNTGMTAKDMEFIEQMKFTRDEILAIFKVPKALLDPQELNYASARVAKEVFLNEVIVPLMKDLVSTLNEFLLPNYGDDSLFFDFQHPGEENPETRNAWIASRVAAGALAPNEIRAMDNLPPFEGGNQIFISAMQTPIGEAEINQGKMLVGKVDKIEIPKKYNVAIKSKSEMADIKAELTEEIKKKINKDIEKNIEKKQKILPEEVKIKTEKELYGEMVWNAKIVKTNVDEREMRKMLSREFIRQQKKVLNSLKEKSFTFDWDDEYEEGIFIKVFTPFMTNVIKNYGEDALDMINMSGFNLSDRAKDWLSENVKNFAGEVNNTTKDKIRAALSKAVEEGEGIPDAAKRVREVFTEANTSRARAIARTEVLHASNYASVEAWKQSDVVEQKEWLTALDERTCEECEGLDGKVIDLDSNFKNADDIFGHASEPPAHINCRCTLLPVLKTKSAMISELKNEKDKLEKTIDEVKKEGEKAVNEIKDTKDKLNKIIENG